MNGSEALLDANDTQLAPGAVCRDIPFRIAMTTSCRDCDHLPKVANAGAVVVENGQRAQIMHNGVRVIAGGYDGDWMMEIITRLRGHHEPQEELVFHEILKRLPEQATMIELGGWWSYYSLWFLHSAPQHRRAIVVEPDPHHLAVGRSNASLNGRNIEFIQAGVGETASDLIEFPSDTAGTISIPRVSVPSLMKDRNIQCLDILHCDTQGAETTVIKSCAALLREKRIRFGVFSTHAREITGDTLTHQRCLAMIQAAGGRILAEHEVHESYSGDGLIAAYFGAAPLEWPALNMSYNRYSNCLFKNPLYDVAVSDELHSTLACTTRKYHEAEALNARLQGALHELRDDYNRLDYNRLRDTYNRLHETLRLAQRRPTRLLRHYFNWKMNRFLLRFIPALPKRAAEGIRRRARKYRPLPRLGETMNGDAPAKSRPPIFSPFPLSSFLTDPKCRKRMTSKFLLYFSPLLSPRFKRRMRRRYQKNAAAGQAMHAAQVPRVGNSSESLLTETAHVILKQLELSIASAPPSR